MASAGNYAQSGGLAVAQILPADTTVAKTLVTGAASGKRRIKSIRCMSGNGANPGTAAKVDILVYDGTTTCVYDSFSWVNTQDTFQYHGRYDDLILNSSTYIVKIVARTTIAASSSLDFLAAYEDDSQ